MITRIDNIVTINAIFSCVPSATTQVLRVLVPFTNPFPSGLLGTGTGTLYLTSGATAINNGQINLINSATGTRDIEIDSSCLIAGVGLTFNMQVIFSYQVQP